MTRKEFLEVLSQTRRDRRLLEGQIRRGPSATPECPITAVAHHLGQDQDIPSVAVVPAAQTLDLEARLLSTLVGASDANDPHDSQVRVELLAACGLLAEEGQEVEQAARKQ